VDNETSTLDSIIEEVRSELSSMLIKRQKLIERLGYAFERVVANPESICEEIKTTLRDEIAEKAISSRDIERYCPDKWKKKTKPQKNDNLSFSDILEQEGQKKVVIGVGGSSLEEPSSSSHSANIGNEKNSSFQSNSEEEYNDNDFGQSSNSLQSEMAKNGLCEIEYSLPFKVVQSHASSAFKLNRGIDKLWLLCNRREHRKGLECRSWEAQCASRTTLQRCS
jgi:hypothetical protein